MRRAPWLCLLLSLAACATPKHAPRAVAAAGEAAPIGPYSPAIARGEFLFLSGQIGTDAATGAALTGIEAQTTRAIERIRALLAAEGLGLEHVVSVSAFLTDMSEYAAFNAAYAREFQAPFPARATIGVAALPKAARVEIQCIAMRP